MTLVEFLEARWREEEQVARSAVGDVASACIDNYGHLTVPAFRVLADIEAKRVVLALASKAIAEAPSRGYDFESEHARAQAAAYGRVLLALVQPYDDHPDYQREWRPDPERGQYEHWLEE